MKKTLYGDRYELSLQIAKIATRLMEEHSCPEAYVKGAELLLQMATNKENLEVLRGLVEEGESDKKVFAKKYKKLGKIFTPDEIESVKTKIETMAKSKSSFVEAKKYLLSALDRPFMSCTRDGGGFLYGAGLIGGASIHVVNCKSHYGRHPSYTFTNLHLGFGVAFAGHGKSTKLEKKNGSVRVESYRIPYSLVSKDKPYLVGGVTAALGLGVNIEEENFAKHFGSKNGVVGGVALGVTGGVGFVKALSEQVPDFELLFTKMEMGF